MSDNKITTETEGDTEGHMPRIRPEPSTTEGDTEGHMPRIRIVEPAGTDGDTEGHMPVKRG